VVLSDGADTGSTASLSEVAHAARRAHARIYTIGLDDSTYNPQTLSELATAGNGDYVRAKTQELAPLFAQLGRVLSSQDLLSYRCQLGPGIPARVNVNVLGVGTTTASYRTPSGAKSGTGGSSAGTTILTSPVTMVVLVLAIAMMIAIFVPVVLQPRRSRLPG